jgi:serine/threonine-protein kinase RsbW
MTEPRLETAVREPSYTSVLTLRFPAKPEYLVLGRLVLSGLGGAEPIEEDAMSDLKLALTEACSNSVRHAYAEAGGAVDVRYEISDGYLAIEVEDDGAGFDPPRRRDPLEPELLEGGLGLAIMRAVSEEFAYRPRDGRRRSRVRFGRSLR